MTGTKDKKVELFLDSGAYSALTQGIKIDIDEYTKFIKDNIDSISVYANLDVIGDAEGTWKNQQYMESKGLNPMPVFHYGEDMQYFFRYLNKYDYIGLGGLVKATNDQLKFWLDPLFEIICDTPNHFPKKKIHGFGLTSFDLMIRYPWYSVDSTSWVLTGRMGSILIPKFKNGSWRYDEPPLKIIVSTRSPSKNDEGKHITTMTQREREILLRYIHEKGYQLGKSDFKIVSSDYKLNENERWYKDNSVSHKKIIAAGNKEVEIIIEPGLCNIYQLRDEINIVYFLDFEKSRPEWPWSFELKKTMKKLE